MEEGRGRKGGERKGRTDGWRGCRERGREVRGGRGEGGSGCEERE